MTIPLQIRSFYMLINSVSNNKNFLELTEDLFYGAGRHKKCYLHPDNDNLCIKIAYNRGGQTDLLREINYIKVLKRRNKNYDLLPQYYGEIETNLGHGYLFEVIRNFDKSKSIILQEILLSPSLFKQNFDLTVKMVQALKSKLFDNEIITMGLFPENVILQKISANEHKVRIVNDMGSGVLIPLEYHFTYFAHTKILRRWTKFLDVLKNNYQSPLINKLIEEIK